MFYFDADLRVVDARVAITCNNTNGEPRNGAIVLWYIRYTNISSTL